MHPKFALRDQATALLPAGAVQETGGHEAAQLHQALPGVSASPVGTHNCWNPFFQEGKLLFFGERFSTHQTYPGTSIFTGLYVCFFGKNAPPTQCINVFNHKLISSLRILEFAE